MGHYAVDMQCDKCGNLRCTCPLPEDKTLHHWVVGDDFEVMTVEQFLSKVHPASRMRALVMKRYARRSVAEKAARLRCEAAVDEARARLLELKNILKVQRPWEQK